MASVFNVAPQEGPVTQSEPVNVHKKNINVQQLHSKEVKDYKVDLSSIKYCTFKVQECYFLMLNLMNHIHRGKCLSG